MGCNNWEIREYLHFLLPLIKHDCACIEFNAITPNYISSISYCRKEMSLSKGGGGAQPNISKEIIVNTFIHFTTFSEQQRIVMK